VQSAPDGRSTLPLLDLEEYLDRALAVLGDGRWHHADDLRFEPRWFDSTILTLVRALKSKGHKIEWRLSATGDWYRLVPRAD
jgi:hypothetical protein